MPIKIACQCGQGFQAPDHLAGKKVRCPKCGNPLAIPAGNRAPSAGQKPAGKDVIGSLLDDMGVESTPTGGKRCPNCNAVMAGHAVFCVECGLDLETQEVVEQTETKKRSGTDDKPKVKSFGNPLLDKAAQELEYDKREKRVSQDPRSWYTYFVGLMLCTVFVAVGAIISLKLEAKREKIQSDLPEPGLAAFWGVFFVGVMVVLYPWGQIVHRAFRDKKLHGFLCLTFVYAPVYAIMRWQDLKRAFGMLVFGSILMVGAYGTYYYYTGDIPESLI